MERFNSIYPFTTENITGYMNDLDLSNKKIITVTGSSDHIINSILKGATEITTFDVNPLTKIYMDLKLAAMSQLSFEDFLQLFLYNTKKYIDNDIISMFDMPEKSKKFWLNYLLQNNNNFDVITSKLFNTKYYNSDSKLWQNMYLNKESYNQVKELLKKCNIRFINANLNELHINENYDYMFLSNISDYINLMYPENGIYQYRDLMYCFLKNIRAIYFAYLYDIGNGNPRSDIDCLDKVQNLFDKIEIKKFRSALENEENTKDGVLILRRN